MNNNNTKRHFIVGGAGSGLGQAIALQLLQQGESVITVGRSVEKLQALQSQFPNQVQFVVGDIADEATLNAFIQLAQSAYISGICMNAGGPPAATIAETTMEQWDMAYQLLLRWKVKFMKAILPNLEQQGYGRIVFIESATVKEPMDNLVLSTAFRLAVTGFVKTLSNEYAHKGITCNILAPGPHNTPAIERVFKKKQAQTGADIHIIQQLENDKIPVKRLGNATEFAQLALWLLSKEAGYITGQTIAVDGGLIKGIFG